MGSFGGFGNPFLIFSTPGLFPKGGPLGPFEKGTPQGLGKMETSLF